MLTLRTRVNRLALDTLYYTRVHRCLELVQRASGVIFLLHHVRPNEGHDSFSPNRSLEVTPEFLESTIETVIKQGIDIVTLEEARRRLLEREQERRFVCFTLDDGFADNYEYASPVFRRYDAPFTIYVTTAFADGSRDIWWEFLAEIVRAVDEMRVDFEGIDPRLRTRTVRDKYKAHAALYAALRNLDGPSRRAAVARLAAEHGVSPDNVPLSPTVTWAKLKEMAESGLASIGAHTVNHFAMSKLSDGAARKEAQASRETIRKHLGRDARHFAYPYGECDAAGPRDFAIIKKLGFATGTTTRKGMLLPKHAKSLFALPRIPLSGDYQSQRYVELFSRGTPFAPLQRFRTEPST